MAPFFYENRDSLSHKNECPIFVLVIDTSDYEITALQMFINILPLLSYYTLTTMCITVSCVRCMVFPTLFTGNPFQLYRLLKFYPRRELNFGFNVRFLIVWNFSVCEILHANLIGDDFTSRYFVWYSYIRCTQVSLKVSDCGVYHERGQSLLSNTSRKLYDMTFF